MKTPRNLFQSILLLTLLMVAGGSGVVAQTDSCAINVIHTYMNGRPIAWDSVQVRVCIPPCQKPYHYRTFMMYWPDTLLSNCPTGIDEYLPDKELGLSQNFPNPCQGESSVKLTTQAAGNVTLQITDLQGRVCCQRTTFLPAGEHLLSLRLPASGFYLVNAQTEKGSDVCKVLCSEGSGSGYDIKVTSSSSCQFVEKSGKGGEGQFTMTDKMTITAYITYKSEVKSSGVTVNTTYNLEGYEFSTWMYELGAINIFFNDVDSNANLILAGNTYKLITSSETCLPSMDIPVAYTITFGDSTFYSEPEAFAPYTSSTWHFNGWRKYRQFGEYLYVCGMSDALPDTYPYVFGRTIIATSDSDAVIYDSGPYLNQGFERLVLEGTQSDLNMSASYFSGCLGKSTRSDSVTFLYENGLLDVHHNLTLNCAASSVIVHPVIYNNTIDINYLVDDNISANCICPTELDYTIRNLPSGSYNVIIRVGNAIRYQQYHNF